MKMVSYIPTCSCLFSFNFLYCPLHRSRHVAVIPFSNCRVLHCMALVDLKNSCLLNTSGVNTGISGT